MKFGFYMFLCLSINNIIYIATGPKCEIRDFLGIGYNNY